MSTGHDVFGQDTLATQAALDAHAADLNLHSSGRELAYAQITSNFAQTAVSGTIYDVPGLQVSPTVGVRPIVIEVFLPNAFHSVAVAGIQAFLYEGANLLNYAQITLANAGTLGGNTLKITHRMAPSAGAHTFKASVRTQQAGTLTVAAASTGPAFLQVVEC